jgi:hypothetical protein
VNPRAPALSSDGSVHPDDLEDLDPTFARDRTLFAWTRTALSFLAVGGTVIKTDPAAGSAILGIGGVIWVLGHLQDRTARSRGAFSSRGGRVRIIAVATMLISAVALLVALFEGGPSGH